MGLAASQARFLAITSRKMNCEFQSMQIAQEKLSVTRDLQKAADEYQSALNATKLIWDGDNNGDGTGTIYDLSYDIMMTPSALNEYDPYLITDTQGRIVLSEDMFQAAVAAGIINENGDPTGSNKFTQGDTNATNDGSRNAFLYQLGLLNQVDASVVNSIIDLGDEGYTAAGIGGEIADKGMASALPTAAFIEYLKDAKYEKTVMGTTPSTSTSGTTSTTVEHEIGDAVYGLNLIDLFCVDKDKSGTIDDTEFKEIFCTTTTPDKEKDVNKIILTKNGQALSENEIRSLTLGDILSGKYEMTTVEDPSKWASGSTPGAADTSFENKAQKVLLEMAKLLGYDAPSDVTIGLNVDSESDLALQHAYDFSSLLVNEQYAQSAKSGGTMYSSVQNAITQAQESNCIAEGNRNVKSISLTNLLKSYLTYFAMSIDGFNSGFTIDKESSKESVYITDDLSYYFILAKENSQTSQDALNADFYNQLYNNLCMYGACPDKTKQQKVTDSDYLNQALKNGQLFVSTLNTDGYYYQGHYTNSAHIVEVTDDDAIAQAEAEYNSKKSKLNYKEQSLEIELKNIDTELSALTTEYDTVKNLISKNVEKVFTMFST